MLLGRADRGEHAELAQAALAALGDHDEAGRGHQGDQLCKVCQVDTTSRLLEGAELLRGLLGDVLPDLRPRCDISTAAERWKRSRAEHAESAWPGSRVVSLEESVDEENLSVRTYLEEVTPEKRRRDAQRLSN
jgi:hypothetical protein